MARIDTTSEYFPSGRSCTLAEFDDYRRAGESLWAPLRCIGRAPLQNGPSLRLAAFWPGRSPPIKLRRTISLVRLQVRIFSFQTEQRSISRRSSVHKPGKFSFPVEILDFHRPHRSIREITCDLLPSKAQFILHIHKHFNFLRCVLGHISNLLRISVFHGEVLAF